MDDLLEFLDTLTILAAGILEGRFLTGICSPGRRELVQYTVFK